MPGLGYQSIEMTFNAEGKTSKQIVLQKGVPVKWKIHNEGDQSCVTGVVVPKLGLDIPLKKGEQIIEFTPQQEGIIPWSCNMGMTTGTFLVVEPNEKKMDEKQEQDGKPKD
jgi:plastocyanin domain-containing protein